MGSTFHQGQAWVIETPATHIFSFVLHGEEKGVLGKAWASQSVPGRGASDGPSTLQLTRGALSQLLMAGALLSGF